MHTRLGFGSTYSFHGQTLPEKGTYRATIKLDPFFSRPSYYAFGVATSDPTANYWDHWVESAVEFEVQFSNALGYPAGSTNLCEMGELRCPIKHKGSHAGYS